MPLQVTVACPEGVDVAWLTHAIETQYLPHRRPHVAKVAQGIHVDGLPAGTILIEPKE